ncbi:MAG: hypothetical protein HY216_00695 [Candidatus Rokubacteria bacterium]|nr:hypothetical protein [Candidatus Rokubacteria bacterium]
MSDTFRRVADLVRSGEVRISSHGYDEMAEDGILAGEILNGVGGGNEHEAPYEVRARGSVDNGWSPYLSIDDARKLDEVREALRRGDIQDRPVEQAHAADALRAADTPRYPYKEGGR